MGLQTLILSIGLAEGKPINKGLRQIYIMKIEPHGDSCVVGGGVLFHAHEICSIFLVWVMESKILLGLYI